MFTSYCEQHNYVLFPHSVNNIMSRDNIVSHLLSRDIMLFTYEVMLSRDNMLFTLMSVNNIMLFHYDNIDLICVSTMKYYHNYVTW